MHIQQFTAVILSAGASSRMGRPKALLPVAGVPAMERNVALFRQAGVQDVRAVIGPLDAPGQQGVAERFRGLNVPTAVNPRPEDGMFSSIRTALTALGPDWDAAGVLLLPVDIPLIRPRTVVRLLEEFEATGRRDALLLPTFQGQDGHPPLLGAAAIGEILAWNGERGMHGFLQSLPAERLRRLAVADAGSLLDMDTPDDHARLEARCQNLRWPALPDAAECRALLELHATPGRLEDIAAHSLLVARLALRLGAALREKGFDLDLPLLAAAGLLHDVAKGRPDHAAQGAALLRSEDVPDVATAMEFHGELPHVPQGRPTEAELVYLADKYAQGSRLVDLEERFAAKHDHFATKLGALEGLKRRREQARTVAARISDLLDQPVQDVLRREVPAEALLQGFTG